MKNLILLIAMLVVSFSANAGTIINQTEVGVGMSGGVTDASTFSAAQSLGYVFDGNEVVFNGFIRQGATDDTTLIDNDSWSAGLRYDRDIVGDFSAFVGQTFLSHEILGLDRRASSDVGLRYEVVGLWNGGIVGVEAGYRYEREDFVDLLGGGDVNYDILRAGIDIETPIWSSIAGTAFFEYLPDLDNSTNLRYNVGAGLQTPVATNIGVKVGFEGHYDKAPLVTENWDRIFVTSMVASF